MTGRSTAAPTARASAREHTLAQLKALDIGYGYTADGGKTFPFRGKGVGLMPSLDDVLTTFPDRHFLIHIKSNDPHEGEQLASYLATLPPAQRAHLIVYGGNLPVRFHQRLPDVRAMSRAGLTQCLLRYIAIGWSGYVPAACHHSLVLVPVNAAPWMWNWPNGFLNRMARSGSIVVVVGPYSPGEFSRGVDSEAEFRSAATWICRRHLDQSHRPDRRTGTAAALGRNAGKGAQKEG